MNKQINVTQSSMPDFSEYVEEIKELWESHWLTNMGAKHNQFEKELQEYLNTSKIKLFVNGHMALESIIGACHLTGEVITTPYTFISTTHAIVRNNLQPIFCDINSEDYTIDTTKIEELITEKTSAIIPVHVYGNICNVKEIDRIAKKYNLKVIYDAAHAFGETYNGKGVANFGDASMFSFHATKVFNSIEGGAVTYKDEGLTDILEGMKDFGILDYESVPYIGNNSKMNEFQAAMGICNLRHLLGEIEKRKLVVERYFMWLKDIDGIKLNRPQEGVKQNYSYFPVVFDGYRKTRDEIYDSLEKNNIYARKYFYPLTTDYECYEGRFHSQYTPIAKKISKQILTLPLYANLEISDVDRICNIILN